MSQDFLRAAFTGDYDGVLSYVNAGGDIDIRGKRGQTALMLSIWGAKSLPIAKLLVERGADLKLREEGAGWRPLTYAAVNGEAEILQLLFDHGDTILSDDWKALVYAAQYRNAGTARMLLERGIEVDTRDEEGKTSLMRAAKNSDTEMIRLLLEFGADPNLADKEGMTPLMYAAAKANIENVRILLERGANPAARNNAGETPLQIARDKKKMKIAVELETAISS
jgi:ankyrin repeat protein